MPPCRITASRLKVESLAILPRAQIACSTIPAWFDFNSFMNIGIASLLIMVTHCSWLPEATFANDQVAYNCNWGYSSCLTNSINRGTIPISIMTWIGGSSVNDIIFRTPITPQCCWRISVLLIEMNKSGKFYTWNLDFWNLS